jgi:hypothetical protein
MSEDIETKKQIILDCYDELANDYVKLLKDKLHYQANQLKVRFKFYDNRLKELGEQ